MASPPQNNPKPTSPSPSPKPKPYPNIFFIEGNSLGNGHGKTRG